MDNELWKMIPEYEGRYMASNLGRIRSLIDTGSGSRGRPILKTRTNVKGYREVMLVKNTIRKQFKVATLIAAAFLGKRPNGFDVCHNNGIRWDDRLENLRYDTPKGNHADKKLHGTQANGEKHGMHKLTDNDVRNIRQDTRPRKTIAADYGISPIHVSRVRLKQLWTHIK